MGGQTPFSRDDMSVPGFTSVAKTSCLSPFSAAGPDFPVAMGNGHHRDLPDSATKSGPLHIAIDLTPLTEHPAGVDRAIRGLVNGLCEVDRENRYLLLVNREDLEEFRGRCPANFQVKPFGWRYRGVRAAMQQLVLPGMTHRHSIDVLHSPAFITPLLPGRARNIVTVHDVTFFTHRETHSIFRRSSAYRQGVELCAHWADLVHVPSEAVKQSLLEIWPEIPEHRVGVAGWGIGPEFTPAPLEEVELHRRRLGLPDNYILFVGTLEPRKNVGLLIEAYRRLAARNPGVDLVLAGRMGWRSGEIHRAMELPTAGKIHQVGFVAEPDLPWFYRAANMLVYPSRYEGFGFPPLEAAACGTPVITTTGSAMEQNFQDMAEFVGPGDIADLVQRMQTLLSESARDRWERIERARIAADWFGWARCAKQMIECYQACSRIPRTG